MSQVIIFKNDNGGVRVARATPEALSMHTIQEVARKDVPAGKPYKIIDEAELPSREYRDAWIINEISEPDGVGSDTNEWSQP